MGGGLASPSEETRTKEANRRKEIKNNEEDLLPLILAIFGLLRMT
jgi:hypothetical protein